ncbi:prolyl oligopeptidase family serine peptidase [Herbidospora cretacea]|uniref:S9 family peptidase n=1 Tax=Herbidospora cretacea TaxID=28444 RepID=UPI0004C34C4D|nr:prolyl oligopeptidase family serine peptidase [Herbidospora cretacea]
MLPERTPLPYAARISTADVARSGLNLGFPTVIGDEVWWEEDRPAQNGRRTIVHRAADGRRREILPPPWDARTRVHEYGGRSHLVIPELGVVFAEHSDQRLYLISDGTPRAITDENDCRYADLSWAHGRIFGVQERHHDDGKVERAVVAVSLDGSVSVLASGADFYASPTVSPDGEHVAYVCWNHPRMPWVGTELRVTRIDDGSSWTVKGGQTESVLAPAWKDDRNLYLVSDWSGWWNLYQIGMFGTSPRALYPAEEEFAGPLWQLGGRPYVPLGHDRLGVLHGQGNLRLGVLDVESGVLTDLDVPYDGFYPELSADGRMLVGLGYGWDVPRSVVRVDTVTGRVEGLRRDIAELPDVAYLPRPAEVMIDHRVPAYLYAPLDATGPSPFVVFAHGGPTAHVTTELSLARAFFTTRGIGVLDVNYGGSTGYGRAYREKLRGQWGVVDVDDVVAAAEWLAFSGHADPSRIAIRGGSAGGWTVLAACAASDVFAGGVSIAGVTALGPLREATHDFESQYADWLAGPDGRRREPLARVGEIDCPLLLLQGQNDPVVPPSQAETFVAALTARGVACTYLAFEGEAHGFRRIETKTAALAAELSFYLQIFA